MPVSPPRPKGPPLNALRAFEAAARLGGFAAAAEELGVTPGAISQHIRAVEDWAGQPLFERRARGVALTRAGAALWPAFARAFDQLGVATRALLALRPDPVIQIAALPSVAQLWLGPRLSALRALVPGLRLSVTALETPPNLSRDMFDLSLFIRPVVDLPDTARVIEEDALLPACAPEVARGITAPSDLDAQTRLHDATWADDWTIWARERDMSLTSPDEGPRFSLYAMAVEDARQGAGVLMGHRVLIGGELAKGTLVPACDGEVATGRALICEWAQPCDNVREVIDALCRDGGDHG